MKEIERLTNYTFFYNNGDFDLKRIVSVAAVRKPVSEVVRQMLPDCSCRFENRRIILVKDAAPQRQTVKGVVKDEKGAPVIGATVLVTDAGQTRGISTDMNGSFTLTLPALTAEAMLEVSFIGFDTYKSAVGSRTFFDVVLTYAQQSMIGSGGYMPEDVRDVQEIMSCGKWDLERIITHEFPLVE